MHRYAHIRINLRHWWLEPYRNEFNIFRNWAIVQSYYFVNLLVCGLLNDEASRLQIERSNMLAMKYHSIQRFWITKGPEIDLKHQNQVIFRLWGHSNVAAKGNGFILPLLRFPMNPSSNPPYDPYQSATMLRPIGTKMRDFYWRRQMDSLALTTSISTRQLGRLL